MNRLFTFLILIIILILTSFSPCKAQHQSENTATASAIESHSEDELIGKKVTVRIYNDWSTQFFRLSQEQLCLESEVYKTVSVSLTGRDFILDAVEMPTPESDRTIMVIVTAEDQKEPVVADFLGDCVYIEPHEKNKIFTLPTKQKFDKDIYLTFNDALGKPIINASVTIYLTDSLDLTKASIVKAVTDEEGKIKGPLIKGKRTFITFILTEPEYGTFYIESGTQFLKSATFIIPASKAGTGYDNRLIWGTVTDPDNNPVIGALIRCHTVLTPGGGKISGRSPMMKASAVTDEKGMFSLCMPIDEKYYLEQIPANVKYDIEIKAPPKLRLLPFSGQIPCGQESKIILSQGSFLIYPVFEDSNGLITDLNILRRINFEVEAWDDKKYSFAQSEWKDGLMLPAGTYTATLSGKYDFERITVTSQPESKQLVFHKLPEQKNVLVEGRVVFGKDKNPAKGAFVILSSSSQRLKNFSEITPQQWQQLNELSMQPSINNKALGPFQKACPFSKITRTDDNGQFELQIASITYEEGMIIIFKQGYFPVKYELEKRRLEYQNIMQIQDDILQIPDIRLYPSATVIFEPYFEEKIDDVITSWQYGDNSGLGWFDDFYSYSRQSITPLFIKMSCEPNKKYYLTIPAEMNLQVTLKPVQKSRKDSTWWAVTYTDIINALQGEIIDLGRITIPSEIPVFVKVTDSEDNPLEGIAVTHCRTDGKLSSGQKHISDANGIARFMVPPVHEAAFMVGWKGYNTDTPFQSLVYKTNGPEDTNSLFIIQLNDDVLEEITK